MWTIAAILLILWAIGPVFSYTMGGFIQILLVVAIVAGSFMDDGYYRKQLAKGRRIK